MMEADLNRRPTRRREWSQLLEALFTSTVGESHALEFKSRIDWDNKAHLGAIARAIIAFSNRDPKVAATQFDGRGMLVLGLEPGNVPGVVRLDPADVENKLEPYLGLGADDPQWDQHWFERAGSSILVLEVAPPRQGDRIHSLRRSSGDHRQGQVFVRTGARSNPASPQELDRLALRRARAAAESLEVDVSVSTEIAIAPYTWSAAEIDEFIATERSDLLKGLGEFAGPEYTDILPPQISELRSALFGHRAEERTPGEFRAQVESYIESLIRGIPDILLELAPYFVPAPTFLLSNLSQRNYRDVEIVLRVGGEAWAAHVPDEVVNVDLSMRALLPARPRRYGSSSALDSISEAAMRAGRSLTEAPYASSSVQFVEPEIKNGGSFTLTFPAVTLRPEERFVELSSGTAVLLPASRNPPVVAEWTATATNVDAVTEGRVQLPIEEAAIDLFAAWQLESSS